MQFIGKPKPLLPFMNRKECSVRLCSTFCPEWCDGIFPPPGPPPPPPPPFSFPDDKSETTPTFSPLVIAVIGILASAFLLVSYYAVITKYCGNSNSSQRSREVQRSHNEEFFEEDYDDGRNTNTNTNNNTEAHHHEAWPINTPGLDEALIKKITLVKFRKGDGLITTTDCSVCLGEFLEDDTLRLLPKCCHAFHVACIDTWLRSHLNCPLCRANVISTYSQPPPNHNNHLHPHLVVINDQPPPNNNSNNNSNNSNSNNSNNVVQDHSTGLQNQVANEEVSSSGERRQMNVMEEQANGNLPKTPFRALSDLGDRSHGGRDTMRRSMSMDHRYETRVSVPDVLRFNHGEDCIVKSCQLHEPSYKRTTGESSNFSLSSSRNSSNRNGVLHSVKSGVAMKRSFSSGRFLFSKHVKGKTAVIPL